MLKLGVPVSNIHYPTSVGGTNSALDHGGTVQHRLHSLLTRTGDSGLGSRLTEELGMYPSGTEAGGTETVFLDLEIQGLGVMKYEHLARGINVEVRKGCKAGA